jgi:NitT/TauT family transport system ATP-binding protein
MSEDLILNVDAASKRFDTKHRSVLALDQTSFDVARGEIVCIVGTSGCGKSTLLSMVAGLEYPTTGEIRLEGRPIDGPGVDRGMVFQQDCLFPWLTVVGNVRFALRLAAAANLPSGIEMALDRSDYLIEAVGLQDFRHAYPKQLSGGMRQRAAIARALVTRPPILLMDEPFGSLDAMTREQMQALLLRLSAAQNTTVLFVTHDVEEAVYLADRVLVLKAHPGELIADIPIDLPRPRPAELRLESSFNQYRRDIVELLYRQSEGSANDAKMQQITAGD